MTDLSLLTFKLYKEKQSWMTLVAKFYRKTKFYFNDFKFDFVEM